MSKARSIIEKLLEHADVLYDEDVTDEDVVAAVAKMTAIINEAIASHVAAGTEKLRGALDDMLRSHNRRFSLNGRCGCDACKSAVALVNNQN